MRMIIKFLGGLCVFINYTSHAQAPVNTVARKVQILDFYSDIIEPREQLSPLEWRSPTSQIAFTAPTQHLRAIAADQEGPRFVPDHLPPLGTAARLRGDFVQSSNADPVASQARALASLERTRCSASAYKSADFLAAASRTRRRILYPVMQQAACRNGVPIDLFDALIAQESQYDSTARSPVGAFGLAQLMPGTARDLGVNRYAIKSNLDAGARYLKAQLNRFGSVPLALAAYNAGPGRVARRWAVPNITETKHYVSTIIGTWQRLSLRQPMEASIAPGLESATRVRPTSGIDLPHRAYQSLIGNVQASYFRDAVEKLGYQTERTGKHGQFEIVGVPQDVKDVFSSRRAEILEKAAELGIASPEGRDAVRITTREKKPKDVDRAALAQGWLDTSKALGFDPSTLIERSYEALRAPSFIQNVMASFVELSEKLRDWLKPKDSLFDAGIGYPGRAETRQCGRCRTRHRLNMPSTRASASPSTSLSTLSLTPDGNSIPILLSVLRAVSMGSAASGGGAEGCSTSATSAKHGGDTWRGVPLNCPDIACCRHE